MACAAAGSAYAQGWVQEGGGWKYLQGSDEASSLKNGWYWLDGNRDGVSECYYFNEEGWMLANTTTPDHYQVNASGAWVENGVVQSRTSGPGSADASQIALGPGVAGVNHTAQSTEQNAGTDQTALGPGVSLGPGAQTTGTSDVSMSQADAEVVEGNPAMAVSTGRVIDPMRPMVALTYDDGPPTGAGNRILDTLAAYGAKATFFLVGDRCASRAAEVQRMVAEGHEVGNHTYQHKYLQKLGAEQILYQINQGSAAIAAAGGGTPTLVRLPGGNKNSTVLANVHYPMIQWSIDTRDWEHKNAQKTINEVLSKVRDGDIVLMHELYGATATATETIVPELVARGYQLVTISEMAQAKGIVLEPGKLYYNFR